MSKQYARLSQNERDLESTNYIVKPQEKPKRSCCFSIFVVFAVLVMLCGAIAIIVGIFFTPQVNTLIDSYWKPGGNNTTTAAVLSNITSHAPNATGVIATTTVNSPTLAGHAALPRNDTKKEIKKPATASRNSTTGTESGVNKSTHASVDHEEDDDGDEEDEEEESPKHHAAGNDTTAHGHAGKGEMLDEAEEKFASWMIRLERFLEKTTGINRPELVVPLFMLLCFFLSLSLASCCCCLLMKRREMRRRRILGKIITDLQTGDSKAVLLSDGDD